MKIRVLGTRGSHPVTLKETRRYGGNTACIEITEKKKLLILDAGTGILGLSKKKVKKQDEYNILLTHLHIDHIQGLGFFRPLFEPGNVVNIWGPASSSRSLKNRLNRYLSPPLFPVHFRDIPCKIHLHEISHSEFTIGPFQIQSNYICHPGPTLGYRISNGKSVFTYLPDHEHILGIQGWDINRDWISGMDLAKDADLLIHDSQYTEAEYKDRVGWGHCTFENTIQFAKIANVKRTLLYHHDPHHTDQQLDGIFKKLKEKGVNSNKKHKVQMAVEGDSFRLS